MGSMENRAPGSRKLVRRFGEYPCDATTAGGDTSLERSYVYGNYIDELLSYSIHTLPSSSDDLFTHCDDMHIVCAITSESGEVFERYEYGDYVLPTVLAPDGTSVRSESMANNTRMFTGRLWDFESRLYQHRHRYIEPTLGRFVDRDFVIRCPKRGAHR